MHFSTPFLAVTAFLNIALGLVVFSRNTKRLSSRAFAILSVSVAIWSIGIIGFYEFRELSYINLSVKSYYIAALLMNASLLVFTGAFLDIKNKIVFYYLPTISWLITTLLIVLVDGFVFQVTELQPKHGALVELDTATYLIYIVFVMGFYFISLAAFSRSKKTNPNQNFSQTNLIQLGLVATGLFASLFNVFLPLFGNYNLIWLGPLFTAFFVGFISYAIFKHKLFDIRRAAVRTLGYAASILSILLIYLSVVYILSNTDLVSANLTTLQRVVFASIAVLSGLLFRPFKDFFDKMTTKIFYRDSYDAQAFIDELNKHLVNSVELEELLTKVALILQENFKSSFATFFIRSTSYFPDRIIGALRKDPTDGDAEKIQELASKLHKKVIYVEKEIDNDDEAELIKLLKKNDIEILVRIVSNIELEVKGIGYIFMGSKKSGTSYNSQDLKVLEIVTNELILAIENVLRFEEIEQFNVTLQKKIDSATMELKSNNEKLIALDEAKDEFVSMASHQLRTPLTSIKGYISMVLEGDAGKVSDTQKQMLGQALFSSQRMVYLISDLLNVSRLKTGKFLIEPKPVYLPKLVESEVEQLKEGAKAKDLTLLFSKPKKFSTLNLDEMKIRQVIMNFIDNAIYYTPNGGKITVSLKETAESVEFKVKDTGIGVPKAEKHKLFAKFYRADNARKARPDGTGLGLFMAKKVIIAQGGSIIFESSEGDGSTFGFSFPKDKLLSKESE